MVHHQMPHHQHLPLPVGQRHQFLRRRRRQGHRLLHVHVLARLQRLFRRGKVPHGRHGQHHSLHLSVRQHLPQFRGYLHLIVLLPHPLLHLLTGIAHPFQPHPGQPVEHPHQILPPVPGPDAGQRYRIVTHIYIPSGSTNCSNCVLDDNNAMRYHYIHDQVIPR